MSHAEIWDDSALVDSWNEAVEEYKHYHSIHASGGNVEEILKAFNSQGAAVGASAADDSTRLETNSRVDPPNGMNGEHHGQEPARAARKDPALESRSEDKLSDAHQALRLKPSESRSQGGPPLPLQHLVGSVHDEGLKSLLMSWYYTGYYTGLYEGQHQAR